jgi:hypothetical protein
LKPVLGGRAAESRFRIREELAEYRVLAAAQPGVAAPRLQPRRYLPQPIVIVPSQRAAQNAIVRMVSIAEAFVLGRLVDATEPRLPANPLVEVLWESEIQSALTWDGRVKSWLRLHKVNVESAPAFQSFRSFIDARNAIAHGLGLLTWHQSKAKRDVAAGLRAVGIDVQAGRLVLSSKVVEECARRGVSLIAYLDAAAPTP